VAVDLPVPSTDKLLAIIAMQTDIVRQGLDLHGVMSHVAEQSLRITGAAGAVVELAEGEDMVYRAVAGSAAGLLGMRVGRGSSLSGTSVRSRETLVCDDSELDPRVDREACRRVGLRSMVVVPLFHQSTAVGVLKVYSPEPRRFSQADVSALDLMTGLIAAAMFNASHYSTDELFKQATTDSLTGLGNRALFHDRLRVALLLARREEQPLGVLMVDMDGLKPINDQHGHGAGDAALREIARRLMAEARTSDTVARLGGDEFGLVLPNVQSLATAQRIAARVAAACTGTFLHEDRPLALGASVGVAVWPDDGGESEALLERADQRMYEAKRLRKSAARAA
jgi:diguanylate cyclase (GGDEF)-like protein